MPIRDDGDDKYNLDDNTAIGRRRAEAGPNGRREPDGLAAETTYDQRLS